MSISAAIGHSKVGLRVKVLNYLLSFLALFFFCVCGKWQARSQVEAGEINSHYAGWLALTWMDAFIPEVATPAAQSF